MGGHQKLSDAQMRASHMSGALQGQMGLRSSVLCPTSSKLSKQHMVLAHMNTHYRKIMKAKSAIDMSPPKSMTQSQKARDRKQREWIKKGGEQRSTSQLSNASEWSDEELYDPVNWGPSDDDDDAKIRDIMQATLHPHKNHSVEAVYGSENTSHQARMESYQKPNQWTNQNNSSDPRNVTMNNTMRPSSARSQRSLTSSQALSRTMTQKSTEGDVLEINSHKFTEAEKPFTPRILKSNKVVSRLSQSRCYTAPKKAAPKSLKTKPAEKSPSKDDASPKKPVPQQREHSPPPRNETPLSESTLMFESLQSRDFQRLNKKHAVPTLDITVDEDHNQWLQEQASKAKFRAKSGQQVAGKRSMSHIEEREEMSRTSPRMRSSTRGDKIAGQTIKGNQTAMLSNQTSLSRTKGSARSFGGGPLSNRRLNEEEEELKYIEFVRDVTNDILDRGIFTNRVLKQVFENHIQRRKGELSEAKMRMKLDGVRRDLGIPPDFKATQQEDETGYSTSRSHRSKAGHQRETPDYYTDQSAEALNDTVFTDVTDKMAGTNDTFGLTTGDLTMTGLEDTNQFGEEILDMTGVDTLGFQSTGDVYSTIRSEPDNDFTVTQELESLNLETTKIGEKETVDKPVEHPKPPPRKRAVDPLPKPRERRIDSKYTTKENLSETMSVENRPKMQRQKAQEKDDDDDDIIVQSNQTPRQPENVEQAMDGANLSPREPEKVADAVDEAILENYEDDYEDYYESDGENKDNKGGNQSDDDF